MFIVTTMPSSPEAVAVQARLTGEQRMRTLLARELVRLLTTLPDAELQQRALDAVLGNDAEGGTGIEPQLVAVARLVELLYVGRLGRGPHRERLLRFSVLAMGVHDKLLSPHPALGTEPLERLEVAQLLLPLLTGTVAALGPRCGSYWMQRAPLVIQLGNEPIRGPVVDFQGFLSTLVARAWIPGCVCGMAAVAAGGDLAAMRQAENLGRALACRAVVADLARQEGDPVPGTWATRVELERYVDGWIRQVDQGVRGLPDPVAKAVQALAREP